MKQILLLDTFCLEMLRGSTPVSCLDILQMDTPHDMLFPEKLSTIRDGKWQWMDMGIMGAGNTAYG